MKKKVLIGLFVCSVICPNLFFAITGGSSNAATNEKRQLAEFPELRLGSISEFPASFEAFYNDHLPFKSFFVSINNRMEMELFRNTSVEGVKIGEDKWLFYLIAKDGENALADYQRTNIYTSEKCADIVERMERTRDYFLKLGVEKFHYYVGPNKESIYTEYVPKNIAVAKEEKSRIQQFEDYIHENSDVGFTYLYDCLKSLSQDYQVFFKYDTHLNNIGSFLISQQMSQDFLGNSVSINDVKLEEYGRYVGDLGEMISQEKNLKDDYDFTVRNYYPDAEAEIVQQIIEGEDLFRELQTNAKTGRTLMLVGDSYRLREEQFFYGLYDKIISVHIDAFKPEMVMEYNPDDMIVLTVERNQAYMEKIDEYLGVQ